MPKKTDSFFIRATETTKTDDAWTTQEIDLGAFVDALGKSVLRILNIRVRYQDASTNGPPVPGGLAGGGSAYINYTLTTQAPESTTSIVDLTDRSIIASGTHQITTNGAPGAAGTNYMTITEVTDVAPQDWTNGYLVGVETLYLNVWQDAQMGTDDNRVSIVLECVSETLSEKAAMALALSQQ